MGPGQALAMRKPTWTIYKDELTLPRNEGESALPCLPTNGDAASGIAEQGNALCCKGDNPLADPLLS